jgi:phosphoglycolate phosphatase-like HAD superfamily hydrolase
MLSAKNNKNFKIFIDLDGTLLEISEKYYRIYCDFMHANGLRSLSKNTYWKLKRGKRLDPFFEKNTVIKNKFDKFFLKNVERNKYLKFDILFTGVNLTLKKLKRAGYKLYIITLRHNKINMFKQINKLGIKSAFYKILCGKPNFKDSSKNYINKEKMITTLIEVDGVIVGDSSADILCGKKLGLKTVAVLNGISNYSRIKSFKPDYIIPDLNSLLKIL